MRLRLITPPNVEPVSSTEAKAHLRVTGTDDDDLIVSQITSARQHIDGRSGILGRALITQTWELTLSAFPAGAIDLPLPPLQSITSIKYIDSAAVEQTLAPADYVVDTGSEPAQIHAVTSWPATYNTPNAVVIRFVCGYGNAAAIPEPIKSAIKLKVQSMHDNMRPDEAAQLDRTCAALLYPYRMVRI